MNKIKITISDDNRIVMIPIEYNPDNDEAIIKEIQIEPVPNNDDDISKDIVLQLTKLILSTLNNE